MIFLSLHELLIFNLSISIFTWTLLAIILNWNTLIILLFFCWWWHDDTHFNHNITLLTTGRSFLNSLVSWFAFWFLFFCVGDQSLRRRRLKITNNFFFHLFTIPQYKSTISRLPISQFSLWLSTLKVADINSITFENQLRILYRDAFLILFRFERRYWISAAAHFRCDHQVSTVNEQEKVRWLERASEDADAHTEESDR